jgi:predicted secreted protein
MNLQIKNIKSDLANKNRARLFVLFLVALSLSFTCPEIPSAYSITTQNYEDNQVVINKEDNGREMTVASGNIVKLELSSQGGAGYAWHMINLDPEYFEIIKEETFFQSELAKTGAPVTHIWKLKARKEGSSEIVLDYFRDWEGISKSVDHFNVRIIIIIHGMKEK